MLSSSSHPGHRKIADSLVKITQGKLSRIYAISSEFLLIYDNHGPEKVDHLSVDQTTDLLHVQRQLTVQFSHDVGFLYAIVKRV